MTAAGLVCGPCGTELPPSAKSYNESAVPSYRVRWTGLSPHLAAALPDFLLPCGSNLLRTSVLAGRAGKPGGSTLDSTIGKTMGKPRYKSSTTTRNLRTLAKVLR